MVIIRALTVAVIVSIAVFTAMFFAAAMAGLRRKAAHLANAPVLFCEEQVAIGSKREAPGTVYPGLSRRAAVAAVAVLPVAGNGRDDAGLPIHLTHTEVEGIADRQITRAVKRNVRWDV
jgi:hypothetical protein